MSAPDKFTPGTWRAVKPDGAPYWGIHTDAPSCTVAGTASGLCAADAQLIAAAPDMYAALQAAAQWLHDNCDSDEPLRQVRCALARAEGRT